jgi:sugar phosphate isomerase/epimerase
MSIEGIRFGVYASTFGNDPRRATRAAREAGFGGLQFDATAPGLDITSLPASGRREFRLVLSAQDEQLIGLRADIGAAGLGPGADVDRVISRLDKVMESAAGLGSPLVCVELGPLPPAPAAERERPAVTALQAGLILLPKAAAPPPPPKPAEPPPDPAFADQVSAALIEIGHHADRYSVVVALRSELSSFASLEQALRQAACPWFGVDLDTVALLRDEWEPDEFFSRLGPLLRHVRARDAVGGAGRRTKPAVVGQGSVPWETLLGNLDQTGYQGWITLDPVELTDRVGAAVAGLKYLSSLIE